MRTASLAAGLDRVATPAGGQAVHRGPQSGTMYSRPLPPEEGLRRQAQEFEPVKPGVARGRKGGLAMMELKLQKHIEHEDKRVKELTEAILYDFLPGAMDILLPQTDDPASELHADRCRAVAGAALCVASLMNAPPGFLEFLLCVPWANLADLYPRDGTWTDIDAATPTLCLDEEERRCLVNQRLHPDLIDPMLRFMYRPEYADSVPPSLRLAAAPHYRKENQRIHESKGHRRVTYEAVKALLDDVTPLHCAAIRGNPAQVDHLMYCGADPLLRSGAGELPLEMVLLCGGRVKTANGGTAWACRCMFPEDAEVWECRSRLARTLIARKCVLHFASGVLTWMHMVLLSLLCMLGLWGCPTSIDRPLTEKHEHKLAERRRQAAMETARREVGALRDATSEGHAHLAAAMQGCTNPNLLTDPLEPIPPDRYWYSVWGDPPDEGSGARVPCPLHGEGQEGESSEAASRRAEAGKAASSFGLAVQLLQGLHLGHRSGSVPRVLFEAGVAGRAGSGEHVDPPGDEMWWNVPDEEQADVYCGWAESVLLKHRTCGCRGCKALAVRAIGAAHALATRTFARTDSKSRVRNSPAWRQTGTRLARIIHAHVCLLLDTQSRLSPTRSVLWHAQMCLQEWETVVRLGMASDAGLHESKAIAHLALWTHTAEADLSLVEALAGHKLDPTQPLGDVVAPLVLISQSTSFFLSQSVTRETAGALEAAVEAAPHGTKLLLDIVRSCAGNARREIQAAEALREVMSMKGGGGGASGAVQQLSAAITAAAMFPSLMGEVREARQLKERWERRAEAVAQLEGVMEAVRVGPDDLQPSSPAFWEEWAQRIATLEQAIEGAREANVSVNRAKRLVKDMQAQAAAAEAATRLEEVLQHKPCGSGALKAALAKAEAAATTAAATGTRLAEGTDLLMPALAAGRRQLEMERAAENLSRAAAAATKLADLPRLEAAILAARKVGAQDIDPDAYRTASDLRATLDTAAKARSSLEVVLRGLGRGGRAEDADAVEAAIAVAEAAGGHLLEGDVERAREALQRWRAAAALEAKLARALRDGANTAHLARTIQEAAAAGVKVADAKRVLKLMQSLEAAMAAGAEGPGQAGGLRARVDAAEQGGVTAPLLADARARLARLMLAEAKAALESALKPRATLSSVERAAITAGALERAEQLLRSQPVISLPSLHENDENVDANGDQGELANGGTASSDVAAMEEDIAAVQRMVVEARKQLAAEAAEQERIEAERAEEQRAKRERQRAERAERERERQERSEREKAEREKAEKERAERRERERAERSRAAKEQAIIAERQRREKQVMERLARQREESQRARRAVPITAITSPGRAKGAVVSPVGPRPSPPPPPPPDPPVVQIDPMVVGAPFRSGSRSDWSDDALSGQESLAGGDPLQRSTSLGLPDAMMRDSLGRLDPPAPGLLANDTSLRSSQASAEDLPTFDLWGKSSRVSSADPEVPRPFFSAKTDLAAPAPPAAVAGFPPPGPSPFSGVGNLLGSATAGFLGRTGGGEVLDPAPAPRPAASTGAAGFVARLTSFWSTGGSPPQAGARRAFSPEPSLGSGTASVERSVNSVSSDTATPRPKYADLGGASWRGVQLWNPSPSPAPVDAPAPATPASLWAPPIGTQASATLPARELPTIPGLEAKHIGNGWPKEAGSTSLLGAPLAAASQPTGISSFQTCRYFAEGFCREGDACPFRHGHKGGVLTPTSTYDPLPASRGLQYANNNPYSSAGLSPGAFDQSGLRPNAPAFTPLEKRSRLQTAYNDMMGAELAACNNVGELGGMPVGAAPYGMGDPSAYCQPSVASQVPHSHERYSGLGGVGADVLHGGYATLPRQGSEMQPAFCGGLGGVGADLLPGGYATLPGQGSEVQAAFGRPTPTNGASAAGLFSPVGEPKTANLEAGTFAYGAPPLAAFSGPGLGGTAPMGTPSFGQGISQGVSLGLGRTMSAAAGSAAYSEFGSYADAPAPLLGGAGPIAGFRPLASPLGTTQYPGSGSFGGGVFNASGTGSGNHRAPGNQ